MAGGSAPERRPRAARRRVARLAAPQAVQARPGPRRSLGSWFASGRIFSALLLAGALAGLWYCLGTDQFQVRSVEVHGTSLLEPDEVRQLAEVTNQPIWFVDLPSIHERLAASPIVERAEAAVRLPDTVVITVVERRPELRWQSGGVQYLVDPQGLVLGPAREIDPEALVIQDLSGIPLDPNQQLDTDALTLARLLALRLPGELGLVPAAIGWDIALGIYIDTDDGRRIVFGRAEHLDRKLAVLGFLQREGTAFTWLDLRSATPYYRNDQP